MNCNTLVCFTVDTGIKYYNFITTFMDVFIQNIFFICANANFLGYDGQLWILLLLSLSLNFNLNLSLKLSLTLATRAELLSSR